MIEGEWKSPRRIAEESKRETHDRFERYMQMSDEGIMERDVALDALADVTTYRGLDGIQTTDRDNKVPQE